MPHASEIVSGGQESAVGFLIDESFRVTSVGEDSQLCAYDASGLQDPAFTNAIPGFHPTYTAEIPGGGFWVGAYTNTWDPVLQANVAVPNVLRLAPDGSIDPLGAPLLIPGYATGIAPAGSNRAFVAASTDSVSPSSFFFVSNGVFEAVAPSLPGGIALAVRGALGLADDRILVWGMDTATSNHVLCCLLPNGTPDSDFGAGGLVALPGAVLDLNDDGSPVEPVLTVDATTATGNGFSNVYRLNSANGALTLVPVALNGKATGACFDGQGNLWIAGAFSLVNGRGQPGYAHIRPNGERILEPGNLEAVFATSGLATVTASLPRPFQADELVVERSLGGTGAWETLAIVPSSPAPGQDFPTGTATLDYKLVGLAGGSTQLFRITARNESSSLSWTSEPQTVASQPWIADGSFGFVGKTLTNALPGGGFGIIFPYVPPPPTESGTIVGTLDYDPKTGRLAAGGSTQSPVTYTDYFTGQLITNYQYQAWFACLDSAGLAVKTFQTPAFSGPFITAVRFATDGLLAVGGEFEVPGRGAVLLDPSGHIPPERLAFLKANLLGGIPISSGEGLSQVSALQWCADARLAAAGIKKQTGFPSLPGFPPPPPPPPWFGISRSTLAVLPDSAPFAEYWDPSFHLPSAPDAPPAAIAITQSSNIWAGGEFTTIAGVNQPFLACLLPSGQIRDEARPVLNGPVRSVQALDGNGILIAGDFSEVNGVATPGVAMLSSNGTPVPSFLPPEFAGGAVRCAAWDGQAFWVGGSFTHVGGVFRPGIARLLADGAPDPVFYGAPAVTNGGVHCLVPVPGGVAIGGNFAFVGGKLANGLARIVHRTSPPRGLRDVRITPINAMAGITSRVETVAYPDGDLVEVAYAGPLYTSLGFFPATGTFKIHTVSYYPYRFRTINDAGASPWSPPIYPETSYYSQWNVLRGMDNPNARPPEVPLLYALGWEPGEPESSALARFAFSKSPGSQEIVVRYPRIKPDVRYVVQFSTNGGAWSAAPLTNSSAGNGLITYFGPAGSLVSTQGLNEIVHRVESSTASQCLVRLQVVVE